MERISRLSIRALAAWGLLAVLAVASALVLTNSVDRSRPQYVEVFRPMTVVRLPPGSVAPQTYIPAVVKQVRVKAFLGSGMLRVFAVDQRDLSRAFALLGLPGPANPRASLFIHRRALEALAVWGDPASLYGYQNREVFEDGPVVAIQAVDGLVPDVYFAPAEQSTLGEIVRTYQSEAGIDRTETRPLRTVVWGTAVAIAVGCAVQAVRVLRRR